MKLGTDKGMLVQLSMPNDFIFSLAYNADAVIREKELNLNDPHNSIPVTFYPTKLPTPVESSPPYQDLNSNKILWWYRVKMYGRMCYNSECIVTNGASLSNHNMAYAIQTKQLLKD